VIRPKKQDWTPRDAVRRGLAHWPALQEELKKYRGPNKKKLAEILATTPRNLMEIRGMFDDMAWLIEEDHGIRTISLVSPSGSPWERNPLWQAVHRADQDTFQVKER